MAVTTPGSGGTLKSATAEGQLIEIINFVQLQEANSSKNPNGRDYVQGSFNINTLTFSASVSLPIAQSLNSSGQLVVSVPDYLSGVKFTPGSGGTFKSATAPAYLMEVLFHCQVLENEPAKNLQGSNNVTANLNSDNTLLTATVSLPFSFSIASDGKISITATEYLLT